MRTFLAAALLCVLMTHLADARPRNHLVEINNMIAAPTGSCGPPWGCDQQGVLATQAFSRVIRQEEITHLNTVRPTGQSGRKGAGVSERKPKDARRYLTSSSNSPNISKRRKPSTSPPKHQKEHLHPRGHPQPIDQGKPAKRLVVP